MTNYEDLRKKVEETVLDTTVVTEIWLETSTVNALLHEAKDYDIEERRLILTFDDGTRLSIISDGQLIGDGEVAYWKIFRLLDYHYNPYHSAGETRNAILL